MTDDVQRIQQLSTIPPKAPLRGWDLFWHWVLRVCAPVSVAAFIVAALAAVATAEQSACINTNLGQRSAPSRSDAKAHIALADLFSAVVAKNQSLSTQDAAQLNFALGLHIPANEKLSTGQVVMILNSYKATLQSNQAYRDANPLGKC